MVWRIMKFFILCGIIGVPLAFTTWSFQTYLQIQSEIEAVANDATVALRNPAALNTQALGERKFHFEDSILLNEIQKKVEDKFETSPVLQKYTQLKQVNYHNTEGDTYLVQINAQILPHSSPFLPEKEIIQQSETVTLSFRESR